MTKSEFTEMISAYQAADDESRFYDFEIGVCECAMQEALMAAEYTPAQLAYDAIYYYIDGDLQGDDATIWYADGRGNVWNEVVTWEEK